MMMTIVQHLLLVLIGLAGGITIGSGLVALLIVLDLVPRLAQLARAYRPSFIYESAIIGGALYGVVADDFDLRVHLPLLVTMPFIGALLGIFVGMLAAALTEVVNVLPIIARRLRLERYIALFVVALVFGKIVGSLLDWLIFQ